MKEEFLFFKDNFLRTDVKVGIKRYKKQRWIAFILLAPFMILTFWFIFKDSGYSNDIYNLPEREQLIIRLNERLKYAFLFLFLIVFVHLINLPNDIHRANMLNNNWKIRLWILFAFYLVYIALVAYFYLQKQPDNLQATFFILLLSNFVFGGNPYATSDEEKLGKSS